MNRVVLIGRLAREPELRYTANGTAVAHLVLAVDRGLAQGGQKEADFFDLVVFSKSGEACAQYLGRGRQVGVEGKLHARSYDDKAGIRRKAVEVVADRVYFLDRSRQEGMAGTPEEGDLFGNGELAEAAQA
ncbi:MAG: single-stranded DNA-binding protein [Peptococcaceae bacterium]|nr:single-stranded DNA-binding protein [Peptococcaceae bacterium]